MATTPAALRLDEPLGLTEVIAEAIRAFGRNFAPLLGVGLAHTGAFLLQEVLPWGATVIVLAAVFVITFGVVVHLLAGKSLGAAFRDLLPSAPVLLVLAFGVGIPFYMALSFLIFVPIAIIWLAVWSYAIPAVLLEPRGGMSSVGQRVTYGVRRAVTLARVDVAHSLGVIVTLVLVYLIVGILMASLLATLADNSRVAAIAISQSVLAPFFFLGMAVLYFDQRARETGLRPVRR